MPQGWRLAASRLQQRFKRAYNTIWFFPVVLLAGAIALFAITTTLDKSNRVSFAALEPTTLGDFLIFAGSPSAARSVLSAIAAGWATILGAVFSISLVSATSSCSRSTSPT